MSLRSICGNLVQPRQSDFEVQDFPVGDRLISEVGYHPDGVTGCQRLYFVALRTFIDGTVSSLMGLGGRNCG
jgi:hypothetical protein